jgi:FKBP-type peptidyl-prolyl cis-trans isomerase FklB
MLEIERKRRFTVISTMNTNRLTQTTLFVGTALCAASLWAADAPKLETPKDKLSYAIGMNIGHNLKAQNFEIDPALIEAGLRDAYTGSNTVISEEEARSAIMAYQQEMRTKAEEQRKELAAKNRAAGEAFLAENAKKDGVKVKEITLPDGKKAELQYKILTEGHGEIPKENHTVTVKYRGTLIDGTEFDSSEKHGGTSQFPVTGVVIKGWTEALLMMPVGSKWQLFIPADLAYGDMQRGPQIAPGSTLVFEMELLATKGPEPIVSDIIKVPSAEEMKKGAKIETIKAEDVEKLKAEQKK